ALGIALGNTLEGLVGAWLVNRFAGGVKAFERPQDVFKFTVLAALLSTMVSATIGVTCVSLAGEPDPSYFSIWLTWWLGDVGGALLVTPVLLLWWADPVVHWTRKEFVKAGLLLLALVLISQIVFGRLLWLEGTNVPLGFTFLPILVLIAFQFGARETASAMFLFSGLALLGTLHNYGPVVVPSGNLDLEQNQSLLLLHAFLGISGVTALALAAVVSQQRRGEKALQQAKENLEQRVRERTTLLAQANDALRKKIAQRNQAEK